MSAVIKIEVDDKKAKESLETLKKRFGEAGIAADKYGDKLHEAEKELDSRKMREKSDAVKKLADELEKAEYAASDAGKKQAELEDRFLAANKAIIAQNRHLTELDESATKAAQASGNLGNYSRDLSAAMDAAKAAAYKKEIDQLAFSMTEAGQKAKALADELEAKKVKSEKWQKISQSIQAVNAAFQLTKAAVQGFTTAVNAAAERGIPAFERLQYVASKFKDELFAIGEDHRVQALINQLSDSIESELIPSTKEAAGVLAWLFGQLQKQHETQLDLGLRLWALVSDEGKAMVESLQEEKKAREELGKVKEKQAADDAKRREEEKKARKEKHDDEFRNPIKPATEQEQLRQYAEAVSHENIGGETDKLTEQFKQREAVFRQANPDKPLESDPELVEINKKKQALAARQLELQKMKAAADAARPQLAPAEDAVEARKAAIKANNKGFEDDKGFAGDAELEAAKAHRAEVEKRLLESLTGKERAAEWDRQQQRDKAEAEVVDKQVQDRARLVRAKGLELASDENLNQLIKERNELEEKLKQSLEDRFAIEERERKRLAAFGLSGLAPKESDIVANRTKDQVERARRNAEEERLIKEDRDKKAAERDYKAKQEEKTKADQLAFQQGQAAQGMAMQGPAGGGNFGGGMGHAGGGQFVGGNIGGGHIGGMGAVPGMGAGIVPNMVQPPAGIPNGFAPAAMQMPIHTKPPTVAQQVADAKAEADRKTREKQQERLRKKGLGSSFTPAEKQQNAIEARRAREKAAAEARKAAADQKEADKQNATRQRVAIRQRKEAENKKRMEKLKQQQNQVQMVQITPAKPQKTIKQQKEENRDEYEKLVGSNNDIIQQVDNLEAKPPPKGTKEYKKWLEEVEKLNKQFDKDHERIMKLEKEYDELKQKEAADPEMQLEKKIEKKKAEHEERYSNYVDREKWKPRKEDVKEYEEYENKTKEMRKELDENLKEINRMKKELRELREQKQKGGGAQDPNGNPANPANSDATPAPGQAFQSIGPDRNAVLNRGRQDARALPPGAGAKSATDGMASAVSGKMVGNLDKASQVVGSMVGAMRTLLGQLDNQGSRLMQLENDVTALQNDATASIKNTTNTTGKAKKSGLGGPR